MPQAQAAARAAATQTRGLNPATTPAGHSSSDPILQRPVLALARRAWSCTQFNRGARPRHPASAGPRACRRRQRQRAAHRCHRNTAAATRPRRTGPGRRAAGAGPRWWPSARTFRSARRSASRTSRELRPSAPSSARMPIRGGSCRFPAQVASLRATLSRRSGASSAFRQDAEHSHRLESRRRRLSQALASGVRIGRRERIERPLRPKCANPHGRPARVRKRVLEVGRRVAQPKRRAW